MSWTQIASILCFVTLSYGQTYQYPFQNPALPLQTRLDDLMGRLTFEEMVNMTYMEDENFWVQGDYLNSAVPRLGIPAFNWMGQNACFRSAWNGCNVGCGSAHIDGFVTVFGQGLAFSTTFNPQLVFEAGVLIANESRALQNYYPNHTVEMRTGASSEINLMRDGRWGRCSETYGECPIVTGLTAVAFNKGLMGFASLEATAPAFNWVKVLPVARAFGVYNGPDGGRWAFNAITSDVDIRLTFARAWRMLIEAGVGTAFMTSIVAVNGVPDTANQYLLNDLMRDEYGFDGYLMSDCDSVMNEWQGLSYVSSLEQASAASMNAGTDLSCSMDYNLLVNATLHQLVDTQTVYNAVERLMKARFMVGAFDPESVDPFTDIPLSSVNSPEHYKFNRQFTQQAVVLLENDGSLPLNALKMSKIAVIGPNANDTIVQAHTYHGTPQYWVTMTQSISNVLAELNPKVELLYAEGCDRYDPSMSGFEAAGLVAQQADAVILVVGTDASIEEEDTDRSNFLLPGVQGQLVQYVTLSVVEQKIPVIVLYISGGPLAVPWITQNVNALLWTTFFGQSGEGIADVIFGNYNPSGRMPYTIPRSVAQLPPITDMSMTGRTYRYLDYTANPPMYPFGFGLSFCKVGYHATAITITSPEGKIKGANLSPEQAAVNYTANLADVITVSVVLDNSACTIQSNEVVMVFGSFPKSAQLVPDIPLREILNYNYFVVPPQRKVKATLDFTVGQFGGSNRAPSLFTMWLGDGMTARPNTSFNITVNNGGAL